MKLKQVLLFVTLLVLLVGAVSAGDVSDNVTSVSAGEVEDDLSGVSDDNIISQVNKITDDYAGVDEST
ncbi:MAG: hypothetical protein BZ138_07070 [Methanosphaera sp. rholeuAM270]|nr:MAG: hypothetical protein BZ138_07070 [Methanosphaera sp. rholeuAM270]